ncbi:DNA replication/repair protein RecF [Alteraurantiacibacter palmitatis]|uniref:DNA replication and repair protein RecF n=1 Tax=Alteraurantiacibacter palmitatis TaxID=2054628 RepID=A0ABV7E8M1_9SPHN
MALDRITLSTFRNHAATRLDGAAHFNLLVGENGAGKTNVLEALSLLAPGRGLRRAPLADMAEQNGVGTFAISAALRTGDDDTVQIGTGTLPEAPGRRVVQINGAAASALALGEWLAIGWLTPAMDRLFADSASARRRYLDRLAVALDPAHARHASRYEAALRERNRLLADGPEPDAAWLDSIEVQMAEAGAALTAGRVAVIAALSAELEDLPDEPFARPDLAYIPGGGGSADALREEWRRTRGRDRAAGRTLTGPHRDELEVQMAEKAMPAAQCSTGEQKAMLIAITLAHAQLAAGGRPGVLLLDEVAAHLDPLRRAALFERLRESGSQIWLTGTEIAPFADILPEAAVWQVAGGKVERLG